MRAIAAPTSVSAALARFSRPRGSGDLVARVRLPVHDHTTFVLVRPHYPENVGACARAIKTMGFDSLALVRPSRLAVPEHPMAFKMSVRAWDVLESSHRF